MDRLRLLHCSNLLQLRIESPLTGRDNKSNVDKVKRECEDMQKKQDTDLLDFQRKNAARTRGLRSVRDNGAQEFANQLRDLLS